jgi:hypothetical protein
MIDFSIIISFILLFLLTFYSVADTEKSEELIKQNDFNGLFLENLEPILVSLIVAVLITLCSIVIAGVIYLLTL